MDLFAACLSFNIIPTDTKYSLRKLGDVTTLKVLKKTRDRLTNFGKKSETYDEILTKLMNFWEHRHGESGGKSE